MTDHLAVLESMLPGNSPEEEAALDAAIALMRGQSCVWTIDADPYAEMWNGACGIAWTFTEGGPADNECNHCPKCGGRIEISDQPKDTADEQ